MAEIPTNQTSEGVGDLPPPIPVTPESAVVYETHKQVYVYCITVFCGYEMCDGLCVQHVVVVTCCRVMNTSDVLAISFELSVEFATAGHIVFLVPQDVVRRIQNHVPHTKSPLVSHHLSWLSCFHGLQEVCEPIGDVFAIRQIKLIYWSGKASRVVSRIIMFLDKSYQC